MKRLSGFGRCWCLSGLVVALAVLACVLLIPSGCTSRGADQTKLEREAFSWGASVAEVSYSDDLLEFTATMSGGTLDEADDVTLQIWDDEGGFYLEQAERQPDGTWLFQRGSADYGSGTLGVLVSATVAGEDLTVGTMRIYTAIKPLQAAVYEPQGRSRGTILCLGDSWAWPTVEYPSPWPEILSQITGYTCVTFSQGGAGFAKQGDGDMLPDLLVHAVNDYAKGDFDYIVVLGGTNDGATGPVDVANAVQKMANSMFYTWPDARTHFFLVNATHASFLPPHQEILDLMARMPLQHAETHLDAQTWLWGQSSLVQPDGIHPTQEGQRVVAQHIARALGL